MGAVNALGGDLCGREKFTRGPIDLGPAKKVHKAASWRVGSEVALARFRCSPALVPLRNRPSRVPADAVERRTGEPDAARVGERHIKAVRGPDDPGGGYHEFGAWRSTQSGVCCVRTAYD